jgi:hypothetical protein
MSLFEMSDDEARALFHKLGAERDAILAVSTPLRDERDAAAAIARAAETAMNAAIKEAETGLYEIDVKRGRIARMLGGKTGPAKV